ncbi:MAG TPA: YihY/virulence factor BrkB family protein [Fibrobacter sp.]|nr:YihY/virulence factor BrkB family protein [Fibrobacter sp.]
MKSFLPQKSLEEIIDSYAAKSPIFVRIGVISTKSFLYYHGMMRAAALTYTTFLAAIPLIILLTAIALAIGLGNFFTDYLPYFNQVFSWDFPMEELMPILANAEHIPLGKLGIVGSATLFVTFLLAIGSLETNFNVVWENKTSRKIFHQILVYTPILIVFGGFIGIFAGVVSHVQNTMSLIVIEGLHFSEKDLGILINAFWWGALNFGIILIVFLMLFALPSRPIKIPKKKLLITSIFTSILSWIAIYIYSLILLLVQSTLIIRMSLFYGSLAFIPLMLLFVFGVWSIILYANSLVWTICTWPDSSNKTWNWKGVSV